MDGQVQIQGDVRQKSEWKQTCSKIYNRLFGWWERGVPPTWLVIAGCLLVQLGFGLYPVVVKEFAAKEKANPVIFSFYRDLCCSPVLFMCALVGEKRILFPRPKMLIILILLGLTGMFGNQLLYILGVYWAGPDIASAFQPIIPVWTTILAVVTCTEKVPSPFMLHTWVKLAGILIAAGGAIELTVTAPHKNETTNSTSGSDNSTDTHHHVSLQVMGYVSLLLNTFCMAIYVLLQKRLVFNRPNCKWRDYPVGVTAYSYAFGAMFMGLATIYFGASGKRSEFIIPQNSVYALIYAIFITSALCYLLITWSNVHLSATIVTSFWPTQVLVAVVASYFVTGDKLAPAQYGGAVMLILALMMVLFANHMDERLTAGKSVVRCDGGRRRAAENREKEPLLVNSNKEPDEEDTLVEEPPAYTDRY